MNITVTLLIGFVILVFFLIIAIKYLVKDKKEIKKLQEDLAAQQQNIIMLYKHAEEIAEIEKDKNHTDRVIEEAKSDEEILDVINTIVSINNNRVRNNKKDK